MQKYIQNIRITAIAALLFFISANGQILQWSNPTKLKGAAVFTKVIGENQSGIFLLRYRNRFYSKNVIIERYSHRMMLEQALIIDLRNARLLKTYMTTKGLLVVKSKYAKMRQENDLIAQWYSFEFKAIGEPTVLASLPAADIGDRGSFRMRISDDLRTLSLLYLEESMTKSVILNHILLDIDLKVLNQKRVELPYSFSMFLINDFLITNSRETYLLTNVLERDRRKLKPAVQALYHLKDSTLQDFIMCDSLTLKSELLVYDRANDNAVVSAFYGFGDAYGLMGTLFFKLNKETKMGELTLSPFSSVFINEVKMNDRNDGAISEGYSFIKAIPRSDGGMMLIAEQKEIATEDDIILVNGIPQSTSKNVYNFNEIMVLNYDQDAFLDWYKVITKNQTTINDGGYYSSAVIYVGDKFIQILYNDQLRSSGDVMQHTIYNNGKVQSTKLLKSQLEYVAIIPEESLQVSSNKLIIPTSKNRRFALLKVIYN